MKYIFRETSTGLFLFLSIGLIISNLMDTYSTTISSFPLIIFICLAFPSIALSAYDITILSENSVLLNRNIEIKKNNCTLTNKDRHLKYIIYFLLFILHTSYLVTLLNVSLQLESIYFFLVRYILFLASLILLYQKLNRNIKLRRVLINNDTNNKHYQPAP